MAPAHSTLEAPPLHIPSEILLLVLKHLDPNGKALSGRQTCKAAWKHLVTHTVATVAQPLPLHALQHVPYIAQAAKAIPLKALLLLMSHAARMGCIANLASVWALLQPRLNPHHLAASFYIWHVYHETHRAEDPGTAAVRWGHLHVLPWLLRTCPGLVNADKTALTAAKACALPDLQRVLEQLTEAGKPVNDINGILTGAAGSDTPDSLHKMQWVMDTHPGRYSLTLEVACAAASSGDPARLRWLKEHGCHMNDPRVVAAALRCGDERRALKTAKWVVNNFPRALPAPHDADGVHELMLAAGTGCTWGKLHWLTCHRLYITPAVASVAAAEGNVAALSYIQQLAPDWAAPVTRYALLAAMQAEHPDTAEWIEANCSGSNQPPTAILYQVAAGHARLDNLAWLVRHPVYGAPQLDVPVVYDVVEVWGKEADHSGFRGSFGGCGKLAEAVRKLVEAGWQLGEDGPEALCLAAERGDLQLLKLIHEELGVELVPDFEVLDVNSPTDPRGSLMARAAQGGCEAVLEWLVEDKGVLEEAGIVLTGCCGWAAALGDRGMELCLKRLGVALVEGVEEVVLLGREPEQLVGRLPAGGWGQLGKAAARAALACAAKLELDGVVEQWLRERMEMAGLQVEEEGQW